MKFYLIFFDCIIIYEMCYEHNKILMFNYAKELVIEFRLN